MAPRSFAKGAPHLCFSLIARVLLSVPLDYTWCLDRIWSLSMSFWLQHWRMFIIVYHHAAERYVHPSFKWTLEVQNFILDRSMLSKSQQSEFKYFVPCSQMPQKLSGINSRILGLHALVRQLAFSALLLGSAGRFLLIEFGVMCFKMTSMLVRYWWIR